MVRFSQLQTMVLLLNGTACPKTIALFHIVAYHMKWIKTSWTYSISNRCRRNEESQLFDLFKAFDKIESSHNFFFIIIKAHFSSYVCNIL